MAERYHIPEFFASIRFCCQNKSATTCSKHVVLKNKGGDIDVGRRPALKEWRRRVGRRPASFLIFFYQDKNVTLQGLIQVVEENSYIMRVCELPVGVLLPGRRLQFCYLLALVATCGFASTMESMECENITNIW